MTHKKIIIFLIILLIVPVVVYGSICGDWIWENYEWCGQDCYHNTATHSTDMNHDCIVDPIDMELITGMFGKFPCDPSGDLNGDGKVDMIDLFFFANHYGESVVPCVVTTTYTVENVGKLMISFSNDASNIVNSIDVTNDTIFNTYIIADGVTDMRSLEFGLTSSPNLQYLDFTGMDGTGFSKENSIEVISYI